jgi:hypothetical protein
MFSAALSAVQRHYYSPQIYVCGGGGGLGDRHLDKIQSLQKCCFLDRKEGAGKGGGVGLKQIHVQCTLYTVAANSLSW